MTSEKIVVSNSSISVGSGSSNINIASIKKVKKFDFADLHSSLKEIGVSHGEIEELKKAIEKDGEIVNGKIGANVNSWISKALNSIGIEVSGNVLSKIICSYYGID